MSTSIEVELKRLDPKTVEWKVLGRTNKDILKVQLTLGHTVASYSGNQNTYGTGGTVQKSGSVRYSAYAYGERPGKTEHAKISGRMDKNQNFVAASETNP